jgi:hypothetical protein
LRNGGRILTTPTADSTSRWPYETEVQHIDPQVLDFMLTDPWCVRYIRSCRMSTEMNATQAAAYMHISINSMYSRIYAGTGPRMTNQHPPRFKCQDLDQWLDKQYLQQMKGGEG